MNIKLMNAAVKLTSIKAFGQLLTATKVDIRYTTTPTDAARATKI